MQRPNVDQKRPSTGEEIAPLGAGDLDHDIDAVAKEAIHSPFGLRADPFSICQEVRQ